MLPSGLSKINVNTKFFFFKNSSDSCWTTTLELGIEKHRESIWSVCRATFEVADEIDPAELSDDVEEENEEVNDEGDPEEEDKLSKSALKRATKEHQKKIQLKKLLLLRRSVKRCLDPQKQLNICVHQLLWKRLRWFQLARSQATAFKEMGIFMHTTSTSSARTVDPCVCSTNCSFILGRGTEDTE